MSFLPSFLTRAPQYITVTVTGTVGTASFTGSSGTVILHYLGGVRGMSRPTDAFCIVSFSGTTITASRTDNFDSSPQDVLVAVYHINPLFIISTERADITTAGTSGTATVANSGKGWIIPQGLNSDYNASQNILMGQYGWTYDGATTVTFKVGSNSGNIDARALMVHLR